MLAAPAAVNPPKVATREDLQKYIQQPRSFLRKKLDAGAPASDFLRDLRAYLHMNHYEPWDEAELLDAVREIMPEPEAPPENTEAVQDGAEPSESAEGDDLLPFPRMPLQSGGEAVPITGYMIDRWCRPHGTGARRKGGPLEHRHYWENGRKGKQFRAGYRITVGKKRMFRQDWWFAMARHKAEQLRRQGDENATWDD